MRISLKTLIHSSTVPWFTRPGFLPSLGRVYHHHLHQHGDVHHDHHHHHLHGAKSRAVQVMVFFMGKIMEKLGENHGFSRWDPRITWMMTGGIPLLGNLQIARGSDPEVVFLPKNSGQWIMTTQIYAHFDASWRFCRNLQKRMIGPSGSI